MNFDLKAHIHRLLTTNETLDSRLFDKNDVLKENIRTGLLKITDKIIEKTVAGIDGLEVYDICLTGSASNYFYRKESDIDLRIEVHNKNCKIIAKDVEHFDSFLASQLGGLISKGYCFCFQNRVVDVKISSRQIDFTSLYSLKNNKWIIKPNKDILKSISEDEVVSYYLKRRSEILKEFQELKAKNKGAELGEKLNDFYVRTVNRSIVGFPTLQDYLVFKLLNIEGILKPIGADSILAYNEGLSLK